MRKMTQQQLAAAIRSDKGHIGRLEASMTKEPEVETLRRIATVLGVTLRDLAEPLGWYEDDPRASSWDQVRGAIMALDELADDEKAAIITLIERRLDDRRTS